MFSGDLVNKPLTSELSDFLKHASKVKYPWYAIDGNHDISIDGPLTKEQFRQILNSNSRAMSAENMYYAFTPKRGFRVICLDSIIDYKITTNGEIPKKQMEWLANELGFGMEKVMGFGDSMNDESLIRAVFKPKPQIV